MVQAVQFKEIGHRIYTQLFKDFKPTLYIVEMTSNDRETPFYPSTNFIANETIDPIENNKKALRFSEISNI